MSKRFAYFVFSFIHLFIFCQMTHTAVRRFHCESHVRKSSILPASNLTSVSAVLGFSVAAGEIREIWDIWERGVGENRD